LNIHLPQEGWQPLAYWSQFEKKFQSNGHKNQWKLFPSTNMHTNKQKYSAWKLPYGAKNLIHYHSAFQLYEKTINQFYLHQKTASVKKRRVCNLHNFDPELLVWFQTVVPKVCSMDPTGSMTSSLGICAYIFEMVTSKFTYIFNYRNVLLKIIKELL